MPDKADVFIDGGYFAKVRENLNVYDVNFERFSDILCADNNIERLFTFYYDCPPFQSHTPTPEEKIRLASFDKFRYSLEHNYNRFIVRLGKLGRIDTVCERCGNVSTTHKQKRVDNLLTVDLTRAVWKDNISKAILITGDSDFVPAVEEARAAHIVVRVYYSNHGNSRIHDELYAACTERVEITQALLERARM